MREEEQEEVTAGTRTGCLGGGSPLATPPGNLEPLGGGPPLATPPVVPCHRSDEQMPELIDTDSDSDCELLGARTTNATGDDSVCGVVGRHVSSADELRVGGSPLATPPSSQVLGGGSSLTTPPGPAAGMDPMLNRLLRGNHGPHDVLRQSECMESSALLQVPLGTRTTTLPFRTSTPTTTTIPGLDTQPRPAPTYAKPPQPTDTHNTQAISRYLQNPNPTTRVPLFPDSIPGDIQPLSAGACASGQAGQTADAVHLPGISEDVSSGDEYLAWWPLPDGSTPEATSPSIVYHTRAHLPDDAQEAILADTGAFDGIAGEFWCQRQDALARAAGLTPRYSPLAQTLRVQGVGKEAQEVNYKVNMPGRMECGEDIDYEAPIIPQSHVPALAGMKTFERLNGTLDCRVSERKLYIGNDYKIVPGPNTKVIQMYPAISGHLMIPISRFDLKPRNKQHTRTRMNFIAEEEPPTQSTATSSTDPNPPMQYQ